MILSENLGKSFDYAKKMLGDAGRLIILIVLGIIPIVNWIVYGYAARVLKETPALDEPPKLINYGDLFVEGAKVFFASLIYMIIPLLLIFGGVGSFFAANYGFMGAMMTGAGIVLVLIGVVIAFFMLLLLAVGLAHMIKSGKFGKAFAFGEILSIIRGIGWTKYIGWAVIILVIGAVVGGITGAIPVVGWLISAIISPFLTVFVFRSLGLLYNEGAPTEFQAQLTPSSATPSTATGLKCASCGATLQVGQKFCPSCGAPTPPPPPPPIVAQEKFCTSCGSKIAASAKFCGHCGANQA